MITTSKGFLSTVMGDNDGIVAEGFDLDAELEVVIKEDCGDITIGDWAFLTEGEDVNEAQIELLEEVLDEIDNDLSELDILDEGELSDEDDDILYEAVGTTIKRIAKIAKKKPMKAAKVAAKRVGSVAKKAGKAAYDKLKLAASEASKKAREYSVKARDLIKKGAKAAADKARQMASKLAQKAKDLKDKAVLAIKKFKYQQAVKKARATGQPVTMKAPV